MKLKFHKITIDNFLSFGHAEVDLENRGYTLIEGINNDPKDGAKSNGAGKSTIFSAICFALTGETIQGLTSNLNNIITNGDMSVQLEFSADADEFVLVRSRDSKNHADLKITVNGIDKGGKGVRESQEILENYLPELTSDLIGEVILVGQGMPHKFSNNTPSGRKDLLEKLSHSDYMLEDIRSRIEGRIEALNTEHSSLVTQKEVKESTLNLTLQAITNKQLELDSYKNKPDFEKQINGLQITIDANEKTLGVLTKDLSSKRNLLEETNNQLIKLSDEKNKLLSEEYKVFSSYNTSVKVELADKRSKRQALVEEITRLKNIKDICPTCGQKLPHVHKPNVSEQENQVASLDIEITALTEKTTKQNEAYNLNVQDINDSFKEKETNITQYKTKLTTTINSLEEETKKLTIDITNDKVTLNKLIQDRDNFDKEFNKCKEDLQNLKLQEQSLNTEILYVIKKNEEVVKHQEVITKMMTLVKRDFRGILLSNIIKYLDTKCKAYALEIFGTDKLDFKLDGNNISITYLNKPLEALSGGEQQKVDLILQFAIRAMMQEYTGFTSNILVLDEILDNLDTVGCDAVLNFVTNRLSDIESIFIISHHADSLNIGNDSTITVIKNKDGVSYIA